MTNIAYVSYKVTDEFQALNPYWQQLTQHGASVTIAADLLTTSLAGSLTGEWGGVVATSPVNMTGASVAVQVDPGNAASGSSAVWAGIQLASAPPQPNLSNGDPTNTVCLPLVRLVVNQGNLWFGEVTGGGTTVLDTTPYDPVDHKHIRLADGGGSIHADWSADGVTWTNAWGSSISVNATYYPEILTYTASSVASTASFSDYFFGYEPTFGTDPVTAIGIHIPVTAVGGVPAVPTVAVSAVIMSSVNAVVSSTGEGLGQISVPFNYNDTADVIQANVTDAVRAAAGDYSLQVIFV